MRKLDQGASFHAPQPGRPGSNKLFPNVSNRKGENFAVGGTFWDMVGSLLEPRRRVRQFGAQIEPSTDCSGRAKGALTLL